MVQKIARMRTINDCYTEIKTLDPNSRISKNYLYSLVKESKVNCFRSGSRYYIDLDSLLNAFNLESIQANHPVA